MGQVWSLSPKSFTYTVSCGVGCPGLGSFKVAVSCDLPLPLNGRRGSSPDLERLGQNASYKTKAAASITKIHERQSWSGAEWASGKNCLRKADSFRTATLQGNVAAVLPNCSPHAASTSSTSLSLDRPYFPTSLVSILISTPQKKFRIVEALAPTHQRIKSFILRTWLNIFLYFSLMLPKSIWDWHRGAAASLHRCKRVCRNA